MHELLIKWNLLLPTILYLAAVYLTGIYCYKYVRGARRFLEEYFIASRQIGGFVLAMTLVATYLSAGSFLAGPGTAYALGYGWVLLAMTQLPAMWLTLGLLGKKFAIIARRVNAITIVDVLEERYRSPIVVLLGAASIVIFLIAAATAQFMGGAKLFQAIAGLPYEYGVFLFAITVFVYTTIGGFRAVAFTDALQGIIMFIGTAILFGLAVLGAGGIENISRYLYDVNSGLVTPFGPNGILTPLWVSTFWILVGIGVAGLPYVSVRALSYKDSRALHRGMIIGTVIIGWLILGMHLLGVFSAYYLPPGLRDRELAIPLLAIKLAPPILAGVILAGPLAAIMSTVDSQLLLISSAIIRDVYQRYVNPHINMGKLKALSILCTVALGLLILVLSYLKLGLILWINLFALGGLESCFLIPLILGLYWRRGNKYGAIGSMIIGISSFIAIYLTYGSRFYDMYPIVPSLAMATIAYILISYLTPRPPSEIIEKFWS